MNSTGTPSIYVDRFYEMDPQFEDMIAGPDLRDGMIVLIEGWLSRADTDRPDNRYEMARARHSNRWCEVTRFTLTPRGDGSPLVQFLGVYADGTKAPRTYDASYYWIVKRESMGEVSR